MKEITITAIGLVLCMSTLCFADGGYDPSAGGYDPSIGERERAEKDHAYEEKFKAEAPEKLKKMDVTTFCVIYGRSLRGEEMNQYLAFNGSQSIISAEAKRRKMKVSIDLVKKEKIRIGMNLCGLYASWGRPQEENRTVGNWGVHIQHIYEGGYVYTENGVVASWQD